MLAVRTLTVNASHRDQAAAMCAAVPSGAGMFTHAYGTIDEESGDQTIVGYISHGLIDAVYAEWIETNNTAAIVAKAAQVGITVTEQQVAEVLANAVCTTQGPHEWLAENGAVLL